MRVFTLLHFPKTNVICSIPTGQILSLGYQSRLSLFSCAAILFLLFVYFPCISCEKLSNKMLQNLLILRLDSFCSLELPSRGHSKSGLQRCQPIWSPRYLILWILQTPQQKTTTRSCKSVFFAIIWGTYLGSFIVCRMKHAWSGQCQSFLQVFL